MSAAFTSARDARIDAIDKLEQDLWVSFRIHGGNIVAALDIAVNDPADARAVAEDALGDLDWQIGWAIRRLREAPG